MKRYAVVLLSATLLCLCRVHVIDATARVAPTAKTVSERAAQVDALLLIRVVGDPMVRTLDITSKLEEENRI